MHFYKEAGLSPTVVEVAAVNKTRSEHKVDDVPVVRLSADQLGGFLEVNDFRSIGAHSVEKPVWDTLAPLVSHVPITVWVHGFEARDWRELAFNFTDAELETLRPRLDAANTQRAATMESVLSNPKVTKIFVSEFMKSVAEKFANTDSKNAHIIHNVISNNDFPYRKKSEDHRKKILWIRSFSAHNYANDISSKTILELSKLPYFESLTISIFGDGKHFAKCTDPLRHLDNVHIEQRFLSVEEMRAQHAKHGLALAPTRWDSQGLTLGEAMHSGLVPLTTNTAAIPQFLNSDCGILAPLNDHKALADGVAELYLDPARFLEMSQNAAQRSAAQCGEVQTIRLEIDLLKRDLDVK